jgi:hypothetical protein
LKETSYETDCSSAVCSWCADRLDRLQRPRIWTGGWRCRLNRRRQAPPRYRDWSLISVAHEEGNLNDLRAVLGNDIAIKAYREGKLPFPDGSIIARLAWSYVSSEENNKAFGRAQSFVAGPPKEGVQFMVKDSRKYASTDGWGFAQFDDGKPVDEAALRGCFSCHEPAKARDFVFTRYAP